MPGRESPERCVTMPKGPGLELMHGTAVQRGGDPSSDRPQGIHCRDELGVGAGGQPRVYQLC